MMPSIMETSLLKHKNMPNTAAFQGEKEMTAD